MLLDKLKTMAATLAGIASTAKRYIVEIMAVAIGLLLYYINLKNKDNAALKARIQMAQTQKQADLVEADINQKLQNSGLLQKEIDDLQQGLVLLGQKRQQISQVENGKTPEEIAQYWQTH